MYRINSINIFLRVCHPSKVEVSYISVSVEISLWIALIGVIALSWLGTFMSLNVEKRRSQASSFSEGRTTLHLENVALQDFESPLPGTDMHHGCIVSRGYNTLKPGLNTGRRNSLWLRVGKQEIHGSKDTFVQGQANRGQTSSRT